MIEEFLEGEEVSFIAVTNGDVFVPFVPTQDHKRVFDGDQGPNTGGMGAYSDGRILTDEQTDIILDRIMLPTLAQMRKEGTPFTGFLYAGLMMTADGPKILEFNVRMGDPETQAILHGYEGDLAELLNLMAGGSGGSRLPIRTRLFCLHHPRRQRLSGSTAHRRCYYTASLMPKPPARRFFTRAPSCEAINSSPMAEESWV